MTYYDLNRYIQILSTDTMLNNLLIQYGYVYSTDNVAYSQSQVTIYNNLLYYNLAQFYFTNKDYIQNNTVVFLTDLTITDNLSLANQLYSILQTTNAPILIISHVYYTLKYSTVKFFFRDNYKRFLPDYDGFIFEDGSKLGILQTALMQEFDKFTDIIDQIRSIGDIDTIPIKYISYIAQLVGYENTGLQILSDEAFRYLIKNIVEIYNIKGTSYSFELFFNFLGFNVEITEYWFDRRLYLSGYSTNPYTGETDSNKFGYYLTAIDPKTIKYSFSSETTGSSDGILTLTDFNVLTDAAQPTYYSVPEILGYQNTFGPTGYSGTPFTYFKTNIVGYNIISLDTDYRSTSVTSSAMVTTINTYIEMLTPINIYKIIIFSSTPFEDNGALLDDTGATTIMPIEDDTQLVKRSFLDVNGVGSGDINGNYYYVNAGKIFQSPQILPASYVYDYVNYPQYKSNPNSVSGAIYNSSEDAESRFFVYYATNPGTNGIENGTDSVYTQQGTNQTSIDYANNITLSGVFMSLKYRNLGNLNVLNTSNFYMLESWPKVQVLNLTLTDTNGYTMIKIANPFNGDNIIKLNRNSSGILSSNTIELRYLANRAQDGVYNIISATFDNPLSPTYLNIEISNIGIGGDQSGVGGIAFINKESCALSRAYLYPYYSDRTANFITTRTNITWGTASAISGFTGNDVSAIAITDNNKNWVIAGGSTGSDNNKYSISNNDGTTWSIAATISGFGFNSASAGATSGGTWILANSVGYYSISNNNGSSWTTAITFPSWSGGTVNSMATNGTVWIAVGANGYYSISNNNGASWTTSVMTGWAFSTIRSIATNGTIWIVVGDNGYYSISSNNGITWTSAATMTGWGTTTIESIASDGNNTWMATGITGKFSISLNNGSSWSSAAATGLNSSLSIATDKNGYWIALGNTGGAFAISTNNGNTWTTRTISGWSGIENYIAYSTTNKCIITGGYSGEYVVSM